MPRYKRGNALVDDEFWVDVFIGKVNKIIEKHDYQSIEVGRTKIERSITTIDLKFKKVNNPKLPKGTLELTFRGLAVDKKNHFEFGIAVSPKLEFWKVEKTPSRKKKSYRLVSGIVGEEERIEGHVNEEIVRIAHFLITGEIPKTMAHRLDEEEEVFSLYDNQKFRIMPYWKELFN